MTMEQMVEKDFEQLKKQFSELNTAHMTIWEIYTAGFEKGGLLILSKMDM